MLAAIEETNRRRGIQKAYNEEHGITPQTIRKDVRKIIEISHKEPKGKGKNHTLTAAQKQLEIEKLTHEMKEAAKLLEFEHAAFLRDKIRALQGKD